MRIAEAVSDADTLRCWPVMHQLRPHVPEQGFVARVRAMRAEGFRLAYREDASGTVRAVAGFRVMDMLAGGRTLYVDDLVSEAGNRSEGHGHALLAWLTEQAKAAHCDRLTLDSGVQRFDAHRFYLRERMRISAHHFEIDLPKP
jgi:GNAT superfamily N-acetyltransferase